MHCGNCPFFKDKKEEIIKPFNGIYGNIYQTVGICYYFNQKVNEMDYCIEEDWSLKAFFETQEEESINEGGLNG